MTGGVKLIKSMFHRRLTLLAAVALLPGLGLVARLGHLTVTDHERLLAEAERRLQRTSYTPASRGRILDRRGRVLAFDRAAYAVMVEYTVLNGDWAQAWARRAVRRTGVPEEAALAAFRAHADRAFARVAAATGTPGADARAAALAVLERVESMHASLVERRRTALLRERVASGRPASPDAVEAIEAQAGQPIAEQRRPHPIIEGVGDRAALLLERLAGERTSVIARVGGREIVLDADVPALPGVSVRDATERVYPFATLRVPVDRAPFPTPVRSEAVEWVELDAVAASVVGTVRDRVLAEDAERRRAALERDPALAERAHAAGGIDRGRYRPGDSVGHAGIEASREHVLRGLRGVRTEQRDTGASAETAAEDGADVRLGLDVMLQARVEALVDPRFGLTRVQRWHGNEQLPLGTPLAAGVAVVDIATGDVLAAVSSPGPLGGGGDDGGAGEADRSAESGWLALPRLANRAYGVPYPPGSIVKPLVLTDAVSVGRHRLAAGIVCDGHLDPDNPDAFRCWVFREHGQTHSPYGEPLSGAEAVQKSCNIYFYTLGRRLGPPGIVRAYERFGVGEPLGLGVGLEWPGALGRGRDPGSVTPSEATMMGIGQGPITWTPLHAADSFATLARGGVRVKPRLINEGEPPSVTDLGLDPASVAEALRGLDLVVNDRRGTGAAITVDGRREPLWEIPGVRVIGKTGSAQASPTRLDTDGDGRADAVREGSHAWFAGLAGPAGGAWSVAFAVVVEHGGSGGRVSAPLAAQVVRAAAAEGYLPAGAAPGEVAVVSVPGPEAGEPQDGRSP